jgi:hypothetical protein
MPRDISANPEPIIIDNHYLDKPCAEKRMPILQVANPFGK